MHPAKKTKVIEKQVCPTKKTIISEREYISTKKKTVVSKKRTITQPEENTPLSDYVKMCNAKKQRNTDLLEKLGLNNTGNSNTRAK